MTYGTVLITGGAGFIGGYLARALVNRGVRVRVLDNLEPQAHGGAPAPPAGCEVVVGDVTDPGAVARSLTGVGAAVHFAALVGVGQSMYEAARYVRTNCLGTGVLLEEVAKRRDQIRRLVVASSMSIYGEGAYECPRCETLREGERDAARLAAGRWEPACAACGEDLRPVPTAETKLPRPASVYAVTKRDQEELCLAFGRAYGIPTAALRFFNVYGPGQTLSNPYTGVVAILAARLLAGLAPVVFEDGRQTRDFVHVEDVAAACVAALERPWVDGLALNVGTGLATTIGDLARLVRGIVGGPEPVVTGRYRPGDIRHCVADAANAARLLGWTPNVQLEGGLAEMAEWLRGQRPPRDVLDRPFVELKRVGLLR
jgi:dTDP-L-rhamnose 4-epimerase